MIELTTKNQIPLVQGPLVHWRGHVQTTRGTTEALSHRVPHLGDTNLRVLEQLIGNNNLRPIGFLEKGLQCAKSVCLIEVPGFGSGTGFLVSPGIVMTNNHVLPSANHAKVARFRFNYQLDVNGKLETSKSFSATQDVYSTNPALDYTIVSVADFPEKEFGTLELSYDNVSPGDEVNIIQHPGGEPKQIALVDNQVAYVDNNIAQYLTDTLPGSSGSPVFNDLWHLVAIHHSGGWIPEPSSTSTHFRNEGIRISAIIDDMIATGFATISN